MEKANQHTGAMLDTLFASKDSLLLQESFFMDALASEINQLILTNFERLVQLLYRIDVSESKLKNLLKENPDKDAGMLIASLMVERQLEKINRKPSSEDSDNCNEERW